jgi:hypothetical protein
LGGNQGRQKRQGEQHKALSDLEVKKMENHGVTVNVVDLLEPIVEAVMETVVSSATALWLTLKLTLVFPAGIVIVAGTEAAEESDKRVITKPPVGAGPELVIVHVITDLEPPWTELGETVIAVITGAWIERVVWALLTPTVAVMVAVTVEGMGLVVIANLALDIPTGTTSVAGTDIEELEEESLIGSDPLELPTVAFKVTTPSAVAPPTTLNGEMVSELILNGFMVTVAVSVTPA